MFLFIVKRNANVINEMFIHINVNDYSYCIILFDSLVAIILIHRIHYGIKTKRMKAVENGCCALFENDKSQF